MLVATQMLHSQNAIILPHVLGGKVAVQAVARPVGDWLRLEGGHGSILLSETCQKIARHPQVVGRSDARAWAHLDRETINGGHLMIN